MPWWGQRSHCCKREGISRSVWALSTRLAKRKRNLKRQTSLWFYLPWARPLYCTNTAVIYQQETSWEKLETFSNSSALIPNISQRQLLFASGGCCHEIISESFYQSNDTANDDEMFTMPHCEPQEDSDSDGNDQSHQTSWIDLIVGFYYRFIYLFIYLFLFIVFNTFYCSF